MIPSSHLETKFTLKLEDLQGIWAEATDKQRMELIKSIIWTAPSMHGFYAKVKKEILAEKFEETLD